MPASNAPRVPLALGPALRALERRYDPSWLASDPLHWPRRYGSPEDREVAAVVAALLAYGRVASIQRSVGAALEALGPRPATTLAERRPGELASRLASFRHRWTTGEDLAWLLEGVARARARHGSLGALVLSGASGPEPLRSGLAAWHADARSVAPPGGARPDVARRRARAFLLPDPWSGAACKRLLLLARWCLRPDDGLDLGLWTGGPLRPADLLVPLDVHAHRIARQLGLTRRRAADWRAATEVTRALATIDAEDPVRFDFALVRPGIVGRCRYRFVPEVCAGCDLREACSVGRRGLASAMRKELRAGRTPPSP